MKKNCLYFAAIIMAVSLFFSGCSLPTKKADDRKNEGDDGQALTEDMTNVAEENPNPADLPGEAGPDTGKENEEEDKDVELPVQDESIKITDSAEKKGWKMLDGSQYSYVTDDWNNFEQTDEGQVICYSIHFPGSWSFDGCVFCDEKGMKVAEIFPPVVLKPGQRLLDKWQPEGEELVSKQNYDLNGFQVAKTVTRDYLDSGDISVWFPHTYYISDGKNVFAIRFYELEQGSEQAKLFDDIVSSFSFRDSENQQ